MAHRMTIMDRYKATVKELLFLLGGHVAMEECYGESEHRPDIIREKQAMQRAKELLQPVGQKTPSDELEAKMMHHPDIRLG